VPAGSPFIILKKCAAIHSTLTPDSGTNQKYAGIIKLKIQLKTSFSSVNISFAIIFPDNSLIGRPSGEMMFHFPFFH
jgi:hypothetical protein